MAIYNNDDILKCNDCGGIIFEEKETFTYKKEKGRISDQVIKTKAGHVLACTKCHAITNIEKSEFFKDAKVIEAP
jgi:hypothetical protein